MPDQPIPLHCHPAHPCGDVRSLTCAVTREAAGVRLNYELVGDLSRLMIPKGRGGTRRDELWKHTCFEAFFRGDDPKIYCEFNFSPNGDWAAYSFRGYREVAGNLACPEPQISCEVRDDRLAVSVLLSALSDDALSGQIRVGPAAIVEHIDGTKSYWAGQHLGDKPDFHRTETFTIGLD